MNHVDLTNYINSLYECFLNRVHIQKYSCLNALMPFPVHSKRQIFSPETSDFPLYNTMGATLVPLTPITVPTDFNLTKISPKGYT